MVYNLLTVPSKSNFTTEHQQEVTAVKHNHQRAALMIDLNCPKSPWTSTDFGTRYGRNTVNTLIIIKITTQEGKHLKTYWTILRKTESCASTPCSVQSLK